MSLSRQKLTLIGIFALFMGPVILVMLMRSSWWQYQPGGMQNKGLLIQPPVPLTIEVNQAARGKWIMLYSLEQPCEQTCLDRVTDLRQVHLAAGRNREHLAIVLLSRSEPGQETRSKLKSIYPAFDVLTDASPTLWQTLESVAQIPNDSEAMDQAHSYVLDPRLNVILAYGANSEPGDVHKDLKRLLKLSEQENAR